MGGDHRFAPGWTYGLTELPGAREEIAGASAGGRSGLLLGDHPADPGPPGGGRADRAGGDRGRRQERGQRRRPGRGLDLRLRRHERGPGALPAAAARPRAGDPGGALPPGRTGARRAGRGAAAPPATAGDDRLLAPPDADDPGAAGHLLRPPDAGPDAPRTCSRRRGEFYAGAAVRAGGGDRRGAGACTASGRRARTWPSSPTWSTRRPGWWWPWGRRTTWARAPPGRRCRTPT